MQNPKAEISLISPPPIENLLLNNIKIAGKTNAPTIDCALLTRPEIIPIKNIDATKLSGIFLNLISLIETNPRHNNNSTLIIPPQNKKGEQNLLSL